VSIVPVAAEFHTTTTRAGYLTSIQLLFMGLGNLFWMPMMRIIGKRPVYLASLLLLVATNIWGYFSHSYGSLLASRLLGGFSSAAADATVPVWLALIQICYFLYTGTESWGAVSRAATTLCGFVLAAETAPKFPAPSWGRGVGFFLLSILRANLLSRVSLRTSFTSTKEGTA
jgi:MFS family permease